MKIKLIFTRVLCLTLIFSQISCVTKSLYEKSYERDKVGGFYVSADNKMMVVIGEKYHYTFPLDSSLKGVLGWAGRSKIDARFTQFEQLSNERVSGSYTLLVEDKLLDDGEKIYLNEIGFTQEKSVFRLSKTMTGNYYLAGDAKYSSAFNRQYDIQLIRDPSIPKPIRIALTPVTVAADGVLWIGGAVLTVLFVSVVCVGGALIGQQCFKHGL